MKYIIFVLIASIFLGINASATTNSDTTRWSTAANNAIKWKLENNTEDFIDNAGSTDSDWFVIGSKAIGNNWDNSRYLENLSKKVADGNNFNATDWYRMAIALTSCGQDATEIVKKYTYDGDDNFIGRQGLNSYIWANIALQSVADTSKAATDFINDNALKILDKQLKDGSYCLAGNVGDVDLTAMAIVALSSNYNKSKEITAAIDKSLEYLSINQLASGDFVSSGKANSSSVSQVIIAISTLGINPATDKRFCKDVSALESLLLYQNKDGSFSDFIDDNKSNNMATDQAIIALGASIRMMEDKAFIYSYVAEETTANDDKNVPSTPETGNLDDEVSATMPNNTVIVITCIVVATVIIGLITTFALLKRHKK